jgi:hypothetical protein
MLDMFTEFHSLSTEPKTIAKIALARLIFSRLLLGQAIILQFLVFTIIRM